MTTTITCVDNGYIAEFEDETYVYEDEIRSHNIPSSLTNELLRELNRAVNDGHATKFRVTVSVEPLNDTTTQTAPKQ